MPSLDLPPMLSMLPMRVCAPEPEPPLVLQPNKRRLQEVLARLVALKQEGLALYRALPEGEAFHACRAKFCVLEGSNRSCKTTCGVVELVRALTSSDPYDKYLPHGGVALLVGLKEDNIAMLFRKIAEPGAFKVIPDEHTHLFRAVRPDPNDPSQLDPYDLAYQEKWQDAPPLLAPRFLPPHSIAWNDFGKGVPRTVKIPATGWRLELRPSGSRPDQGDHYNYVQNDEEMEHSDWYMEEIRGLTGLSETPRHTPRLVWTATSQVANLAFAELREKALAQVPGFGRFVFLIKDNPYVPDSEKKAFYDALPEHERDCRYHGIPAISGRRIYGTYDPSGIHGCEPSEIPADWARYAIVDPGTGVCATLLVAIDPDEQHAWVYGGFVLNNVNATQWAYALREREKGFAFEAIVMDERAGKQKSFNSAESTAQRFAEALATADVHARTAGSMAGFFPGTADVKTRTMALREWMVVRPEGPHQGTPVLQVMKGVLPELDKQVKSAISDRKDPEKRAKYDGLMCDLLDCCEYASAANLRYYEPTPIDQLSNVSPAVLDFYKWQKKHKKATPYSSASLG